jgi:hypothetical protein
LRKDKQTLDINAFCYKTIHKLIEQNDWLC